MFVDSLTRHTDPLSVFTIDCGVINNIFGLGGIAWVLQYVGAFSSPYFLDQILVFNFLLL